MLQTPGGTITRTVFNTRDNPVAVYVGTDDTGATDLDPTGAGATGNNMTLVAEHAYDGAGGSCGACDGGNDNLTETTQHVDATTTRVTDFVYDWRNRRTTISASDGATVYLRQNTLDNQGRVTQTDQYHTSVSSAHLVARSKTYYDELGRVYKTETYAVDPSDGSVGDALTANTWYDAAGNVIKQQSAGSQAFSKVVYDGLGRAINRYVGYDTDETSYSEADDLDGDTIVEQTETSYNSAGNVTFVVSRSRLHDATGTGDLTTPDGSQPKARVSYLAVWYDGIGRQTATANYGTNGGTAPTRPDSVPSRSDTVLVSSTEYNADGEAYKTIDSASREDRREFDAAGRVVKTIQNYVDGDLTTGDPDEDVTIEMVYNTDGLTETLTAKGSTSSSDQVTTYVYGTALGGITPEVYRNDLLRAVIYPDSDDPTTLDGNGTDELYDRVEYKYNRQGQPIWIQDQNGTIHEYDYDGLGRRTADRVTTVGAGIDDAVRRIARSYEVRGMVQQLTSYDAASGGNVVNDVTRAFDTLGRPTTEHQEHEGAKDANSLYVEHGYAGFANYGLRLTSIRYPNGRKVHFDYSSTTGSALNRLDAILDDDGGSPGDTLAQYSYLGLGTMVVEDFVEPDVKLDYFGGTSGTYAGFDRFGRVAQQRWYDYGATADRDTFNYGYDRLDNRLYREHALASLQDEYYAYDGVNQLTASQRGTLNAGKTAISGTPVREEEFGLDPLGNWTGYVQKTNGTTDLGQSRVHNTANELTSASSWAAPSHDRAGNMTAVPKPSSLANGLTLQYDAWNRLVQVTDGQTAVARYEYDAGGRRVKRHIDSQSPSSPDGIDRYEHLFYVGDQLVETRNTTTESDQPEGLQPKYQFLWSPRYIDSPILRDENTDADSLCDDGRIYYLTDANMNVTSLVDPNGDALERYAYDPYGRLTIYNADWSATRTSSSYANHILYTGRHLDVESNLYYYRARYYHPDLGRFVSRDPIGFLGGDANVYRYTFGSPTNTWDPSGLADFCWTFSNEQVDPYLAQSKDPTAPNFVMPNYQRAVQVPLVTTTGIAIAAGGLVTGGAVAEAPPAVGFTLLAVGSVGSVRSRAFRGQTFEQVVAGATADVSGVNLIHRLRTGRDIATRAPSPVSPNEAMFSFGAMLGGGLGAIDRYGYPESMASVSRWGREGLRPGDWVMEGGQSPLNYFGSGKWQPGLTNRFAPYGTGRSYMVPRDTLYYPKGWEAWKGILGQKVYCPKKN